MKRNADFSLAAADTLMRPAMLGHSTLTERRRLEDAVTAHSHDSRAHTALAQILLLQGEQALAASHARRAVELAPNDSLAAVCLAEALQADRQYQQAWELLKRRFDAGDRSTPVILAYLRACSEFGCEVEPLAWLGKMIDEASLARSAREVASLLFAQASLLDRLGLYDDAFAAAHRANQLWRPEYDRGLVERMTNSTIEYFDRKTLRRLPQAKERQPLPIFIVGMARSGTSLIEQILASHPAVYGGGESDGIYRVWVSAVQRLSQPNLPLHHSLDKLTTEIANALAAQYLEPLRAIAPMASHVTDKTPSNATHLGLLATLFPNARLIHSRRDPLDTGISCYLTDFAMGNAYSHDLGSIGHFQRLTDRVMSHWKSVLGMPILEVDYEKMVASPEKQIRRLLEFVGLPWDQRCLNFHQNRRVVATASQAQVRRPMYDTSIGRWRHYEKWIGPLKAALEERRGP